MVYGELELDTWGTVIDLAVPNNPVILSNHSITPMITTMLITFLIHASIGM